jgi:hypothetical protein
LVKLILDCMNTINGIFIFINGKTVEELKVNLFGIGDLQNKKLQRQLRLCYHGFVRLPSRHLFIFLYVLADHCRL